MCAFVRCLPASLLLLIAVGCWSPEPERGLMLVYQLDSVVVDGTPGEAVEAVKSRVEPFSPNCTVREGELNHIEILLPDGDTPDVEEIKKQLRTRGVLELRILANEGDQRHQMMIEAAKSKEQRKSKIVYDEYDDGGMVVKEPVGKWIRVAHTTGLRQDSGPFRVDVSQNLIRNAETKEIIEFDYRDAIDDRTDEDPLGFEAWRQKKGIKQIEVLVATDDGCDIMGDHIETVQSDFDQQARPSISFRMTADGAKLMQTLSSANIPDGALDQSLGIIFDDELMTAPVIRSTISTDGQITGKFDQQEIDFIVSILRAGPLPKHLQPEPVKEVRYGD